MLVFKDEFIWTQIDMYGRAQNPKQSTRKARKIIVQTSIVGSKTEDPQVGSWIGKGSPNHKHITSMKYF